MSRPPTARRLLAVLSAWLALSCAMVLATGGVAWAKKKAAVAKPADAGAASANAGEGSDAQAGGAGGDAEAQAKVKVERGAGGKKVYRIEGEIVIEGKIQKPEAFYVLQKSSINYDWHELKQDFVPKILDSVTKAPF
jgi:hypothetical protein